MPEIVLKKPESLSALHQLCLQVWCQLLEEVKLFNNYIEVVLECLLDIASYVVVKCRLDMERLV